MIIGIPKEIKNQEYRVGLLPKHVQELVKQGHEIVVENHAGIGLGLSDEEYSLAGASICNVNEIFERAEMIVKVKEPQANEIAMLRPQQILFTYLHLAPDIQQTNGLISSGVRAIAYETVKTKGDYLPLLAPMSEVAGRLSIQAAAYHLEKKQGGCGKLIAGIPGVPAAKVLIIGAGIVGTNALQMAIGMGADITVIDKNIHRLREIDLIYGGRVRTSYSDEYSLHQLLKESDVVIGAVLVPGGSAPKIIKNIDLSLMKKGSVIVDVAIDQGGCFESSKATTHDNPTYVVDGITHYCVANMPGAVPLTSTYGLTNATFPYVQSIANKGFRNAVLEQEDLRAGVSIYDHQLTCSAVAQSQKRPYEDIQSLLKN